MSCHATILTGRFPRRFAGRATGVLLLVCGVLAVDSASADISLSSRNTFSVTTDGWRIGNVGAQPTRVSGTGPDGLAGYLSHFSDGGGANGKWLMWNDESTWLGNYPAAGVTGIDVWANVSAGGSPVGLRVAFDGPGGWFYSSQQGVGTGWNAYSFPLTQGNFTHVPAGGGTGVFADTMAAVNRFLMLTGSGSVSYRASGDLIQAGNSVNTILIDDVAAVPEPAAVALSAAGVIAAGIAIARRRTRNARAT